MSVDAWLRVEVQSRAAGHPDDWDDWFGFGDDGDDDMTGGSTGGDVGGGGGGGGGGSHRHSPGDGSGSGELERGVGRSLCRPTLDELADTASRDRWPTRRWASRRFAFTCSSHGLVSCASSRHLSGSVVIFC